MRSYIGIVWLLATLFTSLSFVNASGPTHSDKPEFIKAKGKHFTLDGKPFRYVGTNAYWLQLLNKRDLNKTMHDISALGVKVVRAWAFNDVTKIPKDDGVWFQVFHKNGTIEINKGENGLVRLDNIVKAAKDNKLHIVFALTNNWFRGATADDDDDHGHDDHGHDDHDHDDHGDEHKHKSDEHDDDKHKEKQKSDEKEKKKGDEKEKQKQNYTKRGNHTTTTVDRRREARNFFSNDYGGMDVYNKHFCKDHKKARDIFHDDFYTKSDIFDAYSRYVTTIVKRYADEPSVLGWELANDPRCSSGLPASGSCTPQTITQWTANLAAVVKKHDPNHLVSVGDGGFYCVGCTKLFPPKPSKEHSKKPPTKTHTKPHYETEHPKESKHPKESEHPKETEHPKEPEHPKETKAPHEKEKEYRRRGYLTEADLRKRFAERAKRRLDVRGGHEKDKPGHCKTRGHGYAARDVDHKEPEHKEPEHKEPDHKDPGHKDQPLGPIFDGSFGIDTEDLANAPGIDFTTLQYYPDVTTFGPNGEIDLNDPRDIAQNGVDWVKLHAKTGKTFGKPVAVTAFGVLIDKSRDTFVPFNPNDEGKDFTFCTTAEERAEIFEAVLDAGIRTGVNVQQYQWGQRNITHLPRGPIRRQMENMVGVTPRDGFEEYDDDPTRAKLGGAANTLEAGGLSNDPGGGNTDDGST